MKVNLQFDLNDEVDNEDYRHAIDGKKYYHVLFEFDQRLRNIIKYENNLSEDQINVYKEVRNSLYEFLNEEEINLY